MKRIDNATATASLPTYAAGGYADRYFTDGDPGVEDGTVPGQDWFNMVQEELVHAITDDGDTLDGADDTQLAQRLSPLKGIRTDATSLSGVSTTHTRVVVGSFDATVSGGGNLAAASDTPSVTTGNYSAALATTGATVTGTNALVAASSTATVSANAAAALACGPTTVSKARSVSIASGASSASVLVDKSQSAAIASYDSKIAESFDAQGSILLAGVRCELASDGTIATGYHATTTPTYSGSNQNLTFKVDVPTGDTTIDGSFVDTGADYAELFEAADPANPPPVGRILARDGLRVRLAQPGDRVLAVHSSTAGVIGNAAPMNWTGRFVTDEWGRRMVGRYPNGKVWYVETPGYDPTQPYVPRTERPEWIPAGLLGQIRVAVDATVSPGDDVTAGVDGIGTQGTGRGRPIECMAITSPFDAARGYAIALCMVG